CYKQIYKEICVAQTPYYSAMRLHAGTILIASLACAAGLVQPFFGSPDPLTLAKGHPLRLPSIAGFFLENIKGNITHPFQVSVSPAVPKTQPCTISIVKHTFKSSYGAPFVGPYTPPKDECAGP